METKPDQDATTLSASHGSGHSHPGISSSNLPTEIWYKIFSYLLVNDRKNIRLTCHKFYDINYCLNVQKTEEMVFNGSLNTDAAILSFSNSKRKVWNIKLNQAYLLDCSILEFFMNQGTNVRSLIFDDCRMTRGLFKNIIEYCENLNHLALSFCSKNLPYAPGSMRHVNSLSWDVLEIVLSDFNALQNAGIIRQNVTSFSLNLGETINGNGNFTNEEFFNIFAVFPNIKELDLVFSENIHFGTEPDQNQTLSYSCIYYQLHKMRHQLERLNLFYTCDSLYDICPLKMLDGIPGIEMENFKKLSLNCTCLADTSAINTFAPFRFLTDFKCCLPYNVVRPISESEFVELILNTATELCHLTLNFSTLIPGRFDVERPCFEALVGSRLETFCIKTTSCGVNFPTLLVEDRPSPNYTLKYFRIDDIAGVDVNYSTSLMITYFHQLEILIVNKFSEDILLNIFKYQTNLRYLELYNCPLYNGNMHVSLIFLQQWLINTELSNRRLDHLTHLLLAENESLDLSEFLLGEFVFPKLQSLVIMLSPFDQESIYAINDTLWQSIQNLSELEYLEIRGEIDVFFPQWFALCSSLSKLRYLLIFNRGFKQLDDLEYRRLFELRPSLSIIFHGHDRTNFLSVKYFKDSMTNMVRNIPWPRTTICTRQFIYEGIPQKYYKHCYNVFSNTYRDSQMPDLFRT